MMDYHNPHPDYLNAGTGQQGHNIPQFSGSSTNAAMQQHLLQQQLQYQLQIQQMMLVSLPLRYSDTSLNVTKYSSKLYLIHSPIA